MKLGAILSTNASLFGKQQIAKKYENFPVKTFFFFFLFFILFFSLKKKVIPKH